MEHPLPPAHPNLAPVLDWMLGRLQEPLAVATVAGHARMSERTFARAFLASVGITPMRWLNDARVDHARGLLETTTHSVEHIAQASGLGTVANFRRHFLRNTGISPSRYRSLYSTPDVPGMTGK